MSLKKERKPQFFQRTFHPTWAKYSPGKKGSLNPTPPKIIEVPFYTPSPGDRIRIVVKYGLAWRPIFWLKVGNDGSIYLGPRYKNISIMKQGSQKFKKGPVSIKYEDGQVVTDPKHIKGKISFHASGTTHAAGEQTFREPLRNLKMQQELCHLLFQHPSKFAIVPDKDIEDRDICLNYPFNESCPLQGMLLVAPRDQTKIVKIKTSNYQINLLLQFLGLNGVPDLILQFILSHGIKGDWPPYTYLLFTARDGIKQDPTGEEIEELGNDF